LYRVDVPRKLRLVETAQGHPYHGALVRLGGSRTDATLVHTHADFVELFYVEAGQGNHRVRGVDHRIEAGDFTFVRAHDQHQLWVPADAHLQFINISMPTETWANVIAVGGVTASDEWDGAPGPTTVHLTGTDGAEVAAAHRRALRAFTAGPTRLDLLRFLSTVLPVLTARTTPGAAALDSRPAWLVRACAAMEHPENLRLGVRRLVDLASVSHSHLDREMRRHYGSTPTDFVADLRLRRAAMLLATTGDAIGTIAADCGFSTISYFSRCFSARHGRPPRAFRDEARQSVAPSA
jgi:AraC-like DNA-binding protein/mannose-6-phosphate isomerase-like protein (cupin superfamily)